MKKLSNADQAKLDKRRADKVISRAREKVLSDIRNKHIVNFLANLSDADSKVVVDHLKGIINQGPVS